MEREPKTEKRSELDLEEKMIRGVAALGLTLALAGAGGIAYVTYEAVGSDQDCGPIRLEYKGEGIFEVEKDGKKFEITAEEDPLLGTVGDEHCPGRVIEGDIPFF